MFSSNFLRSQLLREAQTNRLLTLEGKLKPARIRKLKKCVRCGYCCHVRTCVPTPDELIKISRFLKKSIKETIEKYFGIDVAEGVYFVRPLGVNIKDLAGKFIPWERTYDEGKCIFLRKMPFKTKCKIYPVRPKQARVLKCWKEEREYNYLKSWRNDILKKRFNIDGEGLDINTDI